MENKWNAEDELELDMENGNPTSQSSEKVLEDGRRVTLIRINDLGMAKFYFENLKKRQKFLVQAIVFSFALLKFFKETKKQAFEELANQFQQEGGQILIALMSENLSNRLPDFEHFATEEQALESLGMQQSEIKSLVGLLDGEYKDTEEQEPESEPERPTFRYEFKEQLLANGSTVVVFTVWGNLDDFADFEVTEMLTQFIIKGHKFFVIDCTYVKYFNDAAIANVNNQLNSSGGGVVLINISEKMAFLFDTMLQGVYTIYDSEEEAIKAFENK